MRILIVDDEFTSRRILQAALKEIGSCDTACSGEEACIAYREAIQEKEPYDLILLDIMMPGKDGNEVLRIIRAEEEKARIHGSDRVKIAMATSLHDREHVVNSFHDGCDGYIVKPLSTASILRDLKRHELI